MTKTVEEYVAAGGVVVDGDQVLVLRWPRRGEVRLPKGHVEPGETVQEAALRETTEESGYRSVRIVADLGSQQVNFEDGRRRVARLERYFLMVLDRRSRSRDGQGEAKFDPQWMTWRQALQNMTFPAEREWIRRARRLTNELDEGEEQRGSI